MSDDFGATFVVSFNLDYGWQLLQLRCPHGLPIEPPAEQINFLLPFLSIDDKCQWFAVESLRSLSYHRCWLEGLGVCVSYITWYLAGVNMTELLPKLVALSLDFLIVLVIKLEINNQLKEVRNLRFWRNWMLSLNGMN